MYDCVKEGLPRTNNSLEGWHNAFAKNLPAHPALPKLVAKYRSEQKSKSIKWYKHECGDLRPSQRQKYKKVTEKLKRLIDKFDSGILADLDYLDRLAWRMEIPTR